MVQVKNFLKNGRDILTRRQSNIVSAAFVISLTFGVSGILGILREGLLVSRFFGCCRERLDVYYAAFRLPDMIFQLIVIGALSAAFIPVFSECLSKDEKLANRLSSSLINLLLLFFLFLAILIFIFATPFSKTITGNFTPQQVILMAQMTRVMLLAQIFFLISNFLSAMIQTHQRFLLPSLSPVVYNLGIIMSVLLLSPLLGIWSATVGVLIGSFLHLLIQLPLAYKLGFRYSFILEVKLPEVRRVVRLMFPRTLTMAASQVEATVSLFLATSLSSGSLTIYYLAQRLADLPVRLLGTSIGQAALPTLSLQVAQNKIEEFKNTISQTFSQIFFLALPATAVFLVLRVQFVRFAYGAKSFPWTATIITSNTLAAITLSIFSQSLIQLLVRAFYALHDTKIPFVVSIISMVINIFLSVVFIFAFKMGIFGLALAFSIANFVNFLLLFFIFNFYKQRFIKNGDLLTWFKMGFASIMTGFSIWCSMRVLDTYVFNTTKSLPLLILTLISVSVGFVVYFSFSKIFKFKELEVVLSLSQKISKWKNALSPVEEIIEPHSGGGVASR